MANRQSPAGFFTSAAIGNAAVGLRPVGEDEMKADRCKLGAIFS
jgi:hypothetical protein